MEEEIATHSSILAWRIPWTEEPGGLQSMASQESDTTEMTENQGEKDFWNQGMVFGNQDVHSGIIKA